MFSVRSKVPRLAASALCLSLLAAMPGAGRTQSATESTSTLETGQSLFSGGAPRAVVVSDGDRDRILDIVSANLADDTVTVFIGRGDGTFAEGDIWPAGDGPTGLAVGLV